MDLRLAQHREHWLGAVITDVIATLFVAIVLWKAVVAVGTRLGWFEPVLDDTPEHCASVKVSCVVGSRTLHYNLEFSPDEYCLDRPHLGTALGKLRRRLFFLIRESGAYEALGSPAMQVSDVVLHHGGTVLTSDTEPLILLGVTTGSTVDCTVNITL